LRGGGVVNKADLIDAVRKETGSTRVDAEKSVNATLDSIAKGLKKWKEVQLVGFGSFRVKNRKARTGRNPQTGETIKIAASKTVAFKPGKELKGSL
jgi:DNA-binding protein HU-beta